MAKVSAVPGQAEITRENLQLTIPITARLQGVSLGAAVAQVKTALDLPGMLPAGVVTSWAASTPSSRSPSPG